MQCCPSSGPNICQVRCSSGLHTAPVRTDEDGTATTTTMMGESEGCTLLRDICPAIAVLSHERSKLFVFFQAPLLFANVWIDLQTCTACATTSWCTSRLWHVIDTQFIGPSTQISGRLGCTAGSDTSASWTSNMGIGVLPCVAIAERTVALYALG
jgi:hypothetical protein